MNENINAFYTNVQNVVISFLLYLTLIAKFC